MPIGGRGIPFYRWKTLPLCAHVAFTPLFCTAMAVFAFAQPAPVVLRIVIVLSDLGLLLGWMEAVSVLWGRRRRRSRRYR
jgi:hypothetical protein